MSHNLKTTNESHECARVRVSTYCGPAAGGPDRSRMTVSQVIPASQRRGTVFPDSAAHLTKKQARDLATTLLAWSDNV